MAALFGCSVLAQPAPKLNSISQDWLQRGGKVEAVLNGENLARATNVVVSGPAGLVAEIVPVSSKPVQVESTLGGITSVQKEDGSQLKLNFQVTAEAALAEREIRVIAPEGVSNPLTVNVSPLPEVRSTDQHTRENPQKVTMPAAINGKIRNAAESDFYQISATKGSHVILDVNAYRLGSKLDSSLAVYNKDGKELARSEDVAGLDSVLDFKAPDDGDYTVEIRDFRYQGGDDYNYRLLVGVLPYVKNSFPYGGQRGQTVEFELEGANLDSSKLLLNLAADAPSGRQEIRVAGEKGLSNPFPLEVSELPQFTESEPNSALGQADPIAIPSAVNGRIGKAKDYDAFKFQAGKDQRIVFEVQAFRYGSPLDAVLTLTDDQGNVLQRNDDAAASDARIDYTFPQAGTFFLLVEDLLNRGGPEYGYRLTAEIPRPDFTVTITKDTARIRRGGRTPIRCEVARMNSFRENVKIFCEELPPGIYSEPLMLDSATGSGLLLLSATEDAPLGSFPLKVTAVSTTRGQNVRHEAQILANEKAVKAAFLTVLEAAPFTVASATLMSSIEQNESGTIDVLVERRNGAKGDIKITPEGFSAGREPISKSFEVQPLIIKADETRGTLSLKAKVDSEIGTRPIVLRAEAEAGGVTIAEYSTLVPVRTVQIPFALSTSLKNLVVTAVPSSSGSAAAEGVFTVKAERRGGFAGDIELKLEGVPEGVPATVTKIPGNANEATVKLVASEKAPTGKDVQLTLTGTGMQNDRNYKFPAPPITLTINAPETDGGKEPKLANTK